MIFIIDTTSSIPVYAQIVDQVKRAVASGVLKTGDTLPSLRETAIKLKINPLTVGKAYKQLEYEGVIETRHGLGSYVSETAAPTAADYGRETLARAVDSLLLDAMHLGIDFDEVRNLIDERIEIALKSFAQDTREKGDADDPEIAVRNRNIGTE